MSRGSPTLRQYAVLCAIAAARKNLGRMPTAMKIEALTGFGFVQKTVSELMVKGLVRAGSRMWKGKRGGIDWKTVDLTERGWQELAS